MKAKTKIDAVIGGVHIVVLEGQQVHPSIVESWRLSGKLDRAIAQGIIEDDKPAAREPVRKYQRQEKPQDADE